MSAESGKPGFAAATRRAVLAALAALLAAPRSGVAAADPEAARWPERGRWVLAERDR
jgi:hypothetical protein